MDAEARATAVARLARDAAAMRFDDFARHGETEPGSALLRCKKWIEYRGSYVFGDTRTAVVHEEVDPGWRALHRDGEIASFGHRFSGVSNKVENCLAEKR